MSGSGVVLAAAPMLSWPLLAALGAAAALALGFGIWRRARGLLWRAVAIGILLLALVNPSHLYAFPKGYFVQLKVIPSFEFIMLEIYMKNMQEIRIS